MKKIFKKRSLITLLLLPSFLFCAGSGLILYIWPPRGIAQKTDTSLLGGDHHFWESLHMTGGLLMIAVVAFHLFMNWKTLKTHVVPAGTPQKPGNAPQFAISREALAGIAFFILILSAAIWNFFPESAVMNLREGIHELWRESYRADQG